MDTNNFQLLVACFFSVLCYCGEGLLLPLSEASFGGTTGVYFVVWINSFLFNFYFITLSILEYKNKIIDHQMLQFVKDHMMKFIFIGLCNALNGIFICYSVVLSRTSGICQNILMQTSIPLTLLISMFVFSRSYNWKNLIGAGIVSLGILISFIPMMLGKNTSNNSFWCVILVIGTFFGCSMTVYLDEVGKKFKEKYPIPPPISLDLDCEKITLEDHKEPLLPKESKNKKLFPNHFENNNKILLSKDSENQNYHLSEHLILAVQIFFQFIIVSLLFWSDFLPKFGTVNTIGEWWKQFVNGLECFFIPGSHGPKSNYTLVLCLGFTLCYCGQYFWTLKTMALSNANLNALITTISPEINIIFWICFPSINKWAGGEPYGIWILIFTFISIPFLIIGSIIYKQGDSEMKKK